MNILLTGGAGYIGSHTYVALVAAGKSGCESVQQPRKDYRNNIGGAISLFVAMQEAGRRTLVFSSSATVYGDPASVPIREDFPRSFTNPYGHTKLICEDMLAAQCVAQPSWRVAVLRYFNPVGAHPSGLIGEDPEGTPNT